MNVRFSLPTAAVATLLLVSPTTATTVSVQQIPGTVSANDLSPDGRFIVGETGDFFVDGTYLLDTMTGVMTPLPKVALRAAAVSDDGSVVLGDISDPKDGARVAALYTAAEGWQSIGALPNAIGCSSKSEGFELSADGTIVVGLSWDGCNSRGFRWTDATGMIELEPLANGNNRASALSADGNVIGGFAEGLSVTTPARWDGAGNGELLDPPSGAAHGQIHAVRDDGTVVVGEWDGLAFVWKDGGTRRNVGAGSLLPGWTGIATDVAVNGTIVGYDTLLGVQLAWIQPFGVGPLRSLEQYILDNGGTLPWFRLEACQAISADGRIIVGHGPTNVGWKVTIGTCDGDVDGNDEVDFVDLIALLGVWGPCAGCPADIDGNGEVDFADLIVILGNWGPCS